MKNYTEIFVTIICVVPFSCFAQLTASKTPVIAAAGKAQVQTDKKADDGLVIEAYYVEETINMTFGRRVTKYEVSKLDMVNTYDLGPNNTRTVTPIYRKPKLKQTEVPLMSKVVIDIPDEKVEPVKVAVARPAETAKYIDIDISKTYGKVIDKGYKNADMLKKVADKSYFEDDMESAAKYYAELIEVTKNLDPIYYYRYAESLKAINQPEKANEMMVLFESKNLNNKVAKQ
ncbi:hypothetical protein [Flavobacterium sp. KACC 22761]|uniref:hypothetical protein n=1 Tax=Flavobacterium sp. KACC 22761 TaxID=3092665 RepID=UPI002A764159|nr:hypothetical protein [Flavobacterium sp. KACC 22761]WPO80233.1 hypothetical protein SCB73_07565 [Flavobacterium sp. KACC 22761]